VSVGAIALGLGHRQDDPHSELRLHSSRTLAQALAHLAHDRSAPDNGQRANPRPRRMNTLAHRVLFLRPFIHDGEQQP
jgi:hypothetical protein